MINVFIDLETLPEPDGKQSFINAAKESVKVPSTLTKPKFIDALGLGSDGKYKTVDELKEMWVEKFGTEQASIQGEEAWRKTSFDGAKGEICVIGVWFEGMYTPVSFDASKMKESEMLAHFWVTLSNIVGMNQFRFVAHNAKFDLPFLYHRSVINRVQPVYYNPHGRHGQHHYCTMEAWAGYNQRISMDDLAKALGIQGKGDMDGSKVYDTWLVDQQKVIDYCKDDVRMLREIYNRLEFVE